MYKYIYNPNYNNFIDINSKLGKRTLKNYLLSLLGGEITNNKHHLMSSKVRLIYEGSPEYLKKNKKMIDHLTNWQWNMYNTDSLISASEQRLHRPLGGIKPFSPSLPFHTLSNNCSIPLEATLSQYAFSSKTTAPLVPYIWHLKHAIAQMDSPESISLRLRFWYSYEL